MGADQTGTYNGKWASKLQVPIAFHQGDFDTDELKDMMDGADSWNDFFQYNYEVPGILYSNSDTNDQASPYQVDTAKPTSLCSKPTISGGEFTAPIVIYKQSTWPHSNYRTAMALTTACTGDGTPVASITNAIIEVNYEDFFADDNSNGQYPDLHTIVFHEFGHLMGLGHTCEFNKSITGMPNCSATDLNPGYVLALMYPNFSFDASGNGEKKRSLAENDQGRMNCLYEELMSSSR